MFLKHNLYFLNISLFQTVLYVSFFLQPYCSGHLVRVIRVTQHKTKQNKTKIIGFLATINVSFALFGATNNVKTFSNQCYNFLLVVDILNHLLFPLSCTSSDFDALFPICKLFYVFLLIPLTDLETFYITFILFFTLGLVMFLFSDSVCS